MTEEPLPSYAYLLYENERRACEPDVRYCTWDKDGNPIPFCFEHPQSKQCDHNTIPPNVSFMGCYDDPSCDGKFIGKPIMTHSYPPYAYMTDGRCISSNQLCDWLTDKVAISRCIKENDDPAQCRDTTDKELLGCFSEETCGGNLQKPVMKKEQVIVPKKTIIQQEKKKKKNKNKKGTTSIVWFVLIVLLVGFILVTGMVFKKRRSNKHHYRSSRT